ncbi:hypothetical protein HZ326_27410 [Fusarium oxysporum f. sp. albedinis]|nr:hypothetical protein HZ326_27410 [Fusarium oxysporum f. sp. albedinis]
MFAVPAITFFAGHSAHGSRAPVTELQGIPPTDSQSSYNACNSLDNDGGNFSKTDEEDDEEDDDVED